MASVASLEQTEGQIFDAFTAFAGGCAEMDGRAFVKCLRDSHLLDGVLVKMSDADVIFARHKTKGSRKIDFGEFCQCLAEVAECREVDFEIATRFVCDARGPDYESGSTCASTASTCLTSGPERLFYDKHSYTGTHRNGGPTLLGGGVDEGDVIQDNQLTNRSLPLEDSLYRKKVEAGYPSPLPVLLGGLAAARPAENLSASSKSDRKQSITAVSPKGPERFFYDKSTYTGTHRYGGPDVIGNGLQKESGYEDLSELVNRAHVQDDALQRKRAAWSHSLQLAEQASRSLAELSESGRQPQAYCLASEPLPVRSRPSMLPAMQLDSSSSVGSIRPSISELVVPASPAPFPVCAFAPPARVAAPVIPPSWAAIPWPQTSSA